MKIQIDQSTFAQFAAADNRQTAANQLAKSLGAEAIILLVRDPEIGVFRPAPGFPRTLPAHQSWQSLVRRCSSKSEFQAAVLLPGTARCTEAHTIVVDGNCAVVILGASSSFDTRALSGALRLVTALVAAEARADAASGLARAAQDANLRASALAQALDQNRSELAQKAQALERALADAEHLNRELHS